MDYSRGGGRDCRRSSLGYGVYHVAQGIAGVNADEAAVNQEAVVEEEKKEKKEKGKTFPKDPFNDPNLEDNEKTFT